MLSGSLYNGRTRLDSREYEQLMPYRFFCTQCSFRSKREGHMKKHLELHARGVAVLQCSLCSYRTTRSNHLTRHRLHQHSKTCVSCSVDGCSYVASSDRLLQRHAASHHSSHTSSSSCPCPVSGCSYTATTESRLVRHKSRHRTVDGGETSDCSLVERYHCTKCSYETTQREHFRRHVDSVHNNVRPFLCDTCGRRFKRHVALQQHSLVHGTDQSQTSFNNHQCSICHRTFRSKVVIYWPNFRKISRLSEDYPKFVLSLKFVINSPRFDLTPSWIILFPLSCLITDNYILADDFPR